MADGWLRVCNRILYALSDQLLKCTPWEMNSQYGPISLINDETTVPALRFLAIVRGSLRAICLVLLKIVGSHDEVLRMS
jgi:hypothetical protein